MKKVIFAVIGAILGIPLSYYFQSELVQNKVGGISGYLEHFVDIVNDGNLLVNVLLSMLIFSIIGGLIGYFVDKNEVVDNEVPIKVPITPPDEISRYSDIRLRDIIEESSFFDGDLKKYFLTYNEKEYIIYNQIHIDKFYMKDRKNKKTFYKNLSECVESIRA